MLEQLGQAFCELYPLREELSQKRTPTPTPNSNPNPNPNLNPNPNQELSQKDCHYLCYALTHVG